MNLLEKYEEEEMKAKAGLTLLKVDFEQEDGTHIRNVVSEGPSGELEDLHMTYMFEFDLPHAKGSEEEGKAVEKLKGMARIAVEKTVDVIREMVKDGRIEE